MIKPVSLSLLTAFYILPIPADPLRCAEILLMEHYKDAARSPTHGADVAMLKSERRKQEERKIQKILEAHGRHDADQIRIRGNFRSHGPTSGHSSR
jgi:hypothetical protein